MSGRIRPLSATGKLDEIDHPVLAKASAQFADTDQILFKVKIQRWHAAAWLEADLAWIIAAGTREDGAVDDFYTALEADAKAARARYNAAHAEAITAATYAGICCPQKRIASAIKPKAASARCAACARRSTR
ncbi:hypothetical protein [Acrocarpospora sp. B8E8]|uniref:hypothetical protein n=1 Tax=Acrocarpospora sp. B8E8 TaxID=3153572 RepID=UPI00325D99AA